MPVKNLKDCELLFIGAAATKTTGDPSTLNDGEIGLFTPSGTRLTESNAATEKEFVIMQGRGTTETKLTSGTIKKANIKVAKRKVYVAATEQLDYIGYNGTSGALEAIDDNLYTVRLSLDQTLTSNHGGQYLKRGTYISPASGTTQALVAAGITDSLVKNFKREPERQIRFERVHSNAGAANTITGGTDATHYTFTYGSKYVVGTDSAGVAMNGTDEVNATVVAGDYIRSGTAVTDAVYKIVTVTSGTGTTPAGTPMQLELDIPFQGATVSLAIDSGTEYITAALAAAGDFGIKMTGIALTWSLPKIHYRKSKWITNIDNFGTALVTKNTAATLGNGAYEQIAEWEWFLQGNEGEIYRSGYPMTFTPRNEAANNGYDIIHLEVTDSQDGTISSSKAMKKYTIALPATAPNYAVAGTADDITDVLEVLFTGTADGSLAIS